MVSPNLKDTSGEHSDEDDDDLYDGLYYLDTGVASTVAALSAARCIPVTSCNGGLGHLESCPVVVFWARPQRVLDLLEVAEEAGCGLVNTDNGMVMVYADDVLKMIAFARTLIARRHALRSLKQQRRLAQESAHRKVPSEYQLSLPLDGLQVVGGTIDSRLQP